jgi:transporter family-2 protein
MSYLYYLLSFVAGTAVAIQVGINSQLRQSIGNPVLSSLISFAVGTVSLAVIFFASVINKRYVIDTQTMFTGMPWWLFTGGLFGAFYIFMSIIAPQKIGFANMFSMVIFGQVLLSILFDHFGLFGNAVHALNPMRLAGLALLIGGVYIIQKF